jgi:nucleoside phosphorylase
MFEKLTSQLKTGIMNLGLNFFSIEEKLCYMFWGTKPDKINPILIIPVTSPCMKKLIDELKKSKEYRKEGKVHNGILNGTKVSIVKAEVGSPNASIIMELAARIHVKQVIRVDVCGSVCPEYPIGSVIIPNKALSGEGTGSYYLRKYQTQIQNLPHITLTRDLSLSEYSVQLNPTRLTEIQSWFDQNNRNYKIGFPTIWTTDAIFCEDKEEIARWKSLGAECVDMETAIMYLLGEIFSIPIISIMGVTDQPGTAEYDLFTSNKIHPEMELAMDRAVATVIKLLPKLKE